MQNSESARLNELFGMKPIIFTPKIEIKISNRLKEVI